MKLKALLLALFTAGLLVSVAVAAQPQKGGPGKGKPGTTDATTTATTGTTTGEQAKGKGHGKGHDKAAACKPKRKLELHGDFVAAGAGGFAMTVKKGNRHAKELAGKQVSVLVDAKTRFHGKKKSLDALVAGDRLMVQAHACRADAAAGSILARKVGVKGAKSGEDKNADEDEDEDADEDDKTTTTTTTTTGTATGS